jgi:hypothetical protein
VAQCAINLFLKSVSKFGVVLFAFFPRTERSAKLFAKRVSKRRTCCEIGAALDEVPDDFWISR